MRSHYVCMYLYFFNIFIGLGKHIFFHQEEIHALNVRVNHFFIYLFNKLLTHYVQEYK